MVTETGEDVVDPGVGADHEPAAANDAVRRSRPRCRSTQVSYGEHGSQLAKVGAVLAGLVLHDPGAAGSGHDRGVGLVERDQSSGSRNCGHRLFTAAASSTS